MALAVLESIDTCRRSMGTLPMPGFLRFIGAGDFYETRSSVILFDSLRSISLEIT